MPKVKKIVDEPAHLMEADEGRNHSSYWRQFLDCSDGEVVCGTGLTKERAEADAARERRKHEAFIRKPAAAQLRKLVAGEMLSDDMEKAIKLLTKIVLKGK